MGLDETECGQPYVAFAVPNFRRNVTLGLAAIAAGSGSQAKSEPHRPNIAPASVQVLSKHVSHATKELGDDEQSASKKRTLKDFLDGNTQMSESKPSKSKRPNLTHAESAESITTREQSRSAGTARSSQHGQKQKEAIRNGTFVVDVRKQADKPSCD